MAEPLGLRACKESIRSFAGFPQMAGKCSVRGLGTSVVNQMYFTLHAYFPALLAATVLTENEWLVSCRIRHSRSPAISVSQWQRDIVYPSLLLLRLGFGEFLHSAFQSTSNTFIG